MSGGASRKAGEEAPSRDAVAESIASVETMKGSIDPNAQVYVYVRLYLGGHQNDETLNKCEKVYPKLKKAGGEMVVIAINHKPEEALKNYELYGCTMPMVHESKAAKLPGQQRTWTTPYLLFADRKGRLLEYGEYKLLKDEDWVKLARRKPMPRPTGKVASKIKKSMLIHGSLQKKPRYYIYLSGEARSVPTLRGLEWYHRHYDELRKAGVEVLFCCWDAGESRAGEELLVKEKIDLPTISRRDARKLPGFDDIIGASATLVDEFGHIITRLNDFNKVEYQIENWEELIADWEKNGGAQEQAGDGAVSHGSPRSADRKREKQNNNDQD